MSLLIDFMSYDEPRAVLGVSEEELEDGTLELPVYSKQLSMDLEDVYTGLVQLYLSKQVLTIRTPEEQKLLDVVSVYAIYATSKTLLTSASLFAPKQVSDGRASTDRIADPFQSVREGVDATLAIMKARVYLTISALGNQVAATTSRSYFKAAGLSNNTITNV